MSNTGGISASGVQELQRLRRKLDQGVRPGRGISIVNRPDGIIISANPRKGNPPGGIGLEVFRAKFTTFPDQSTDPGILLCTTYGDDGTLGDEEVTVIGMEPHSLNDDLLIWQPPGGALGREYNARRANGTVTGASQDYTYSIDETKVVWQEFTTRKNVMVWTNQNYANLGDLYPYTCRWCHVRGNDFDQGTTNRLGKLVKAEEFQYQRYGVTSHTLWKEPGQDSTPMLPAIWTGDYDSSSPATPMPVFLTGHTTHTGISGSAIEIPGFDDQEWGTAVGTTPVTTQGTSGSHPSVMNGYSNFQVAVPGGKMRRLTFDDSGRLLHVSTAT